MAETYNGLAAIEMNPIDIVKFLQRNYGGSNYSIHFTTTDGFYQINFWQNLTDEQKKLRPHQRAQVANKRTMSVFIDGACKSDYSHITENNMTYLSLGNSGDCRKIIDPFVKTFGGYIKDELGMPEYNGEFVPIDEIEKKEEA